MKAVIDSKYNQAWRFLTMCEGFGSSDASWEPLSAFILPASTVNAILIDYLQRNSIMEVAGLA